MKGLGRRSGGSEQVGAGQGESVAEDAMSAECRVCLDRRFTSIVMHSAI